MLCLGNSCPNVRSWLASMAAYVRVYAIASFYQLELWIDEDRKLACLLRQQSEQILYHRSPSKRMKTNHQRSASWLSIREIRW